MLLDNHQFTCKLLGLQHCALHIMETVSQSPDQIIEANIQARLRSDLDSDMLEVVEISGKGRGIKTLQVLSKGDFVAEYSGDLIPGGLAKEKEKEYKPPSSAAEKVPAPLPPIS